MWGISLLRCPFFSFLSKENEQKTRKKVKKCRKVLSVSKKDVPLHSRFGGSALKAALKEATKLLKRHIVGEVAELVDALL